MAENVMDKLRGNLRISIVRPSGILSCWKEPIPGWLDQLGPTAGVMYPLGLGMSTIFMMKDKPN
jgi:hypothetical protein